jgi:hypothetical protein
MLTFRISVLVLCLISTEPPDINLRAVIVFYIWEVLVITSFALSMRSLMPSSHYNLHAIYSYHIHGHCRSTGDSDSTLL